MDFIVPLLARIMNIYVAGQVYIVGMFALIISGTWRSTALSSAAGPRFRCSLFRCSTITTFLSG